MAKDDSMDSFGKVMPEKGNYDSDEIVAKVQKHLKDHGGAKDDVGLEEPPTPESEDETAEEEESTPTEENSADESESTPEPKDKQAADDSGDKDKDSPAIPDNHYRALIHSGWEPEKVSAIYEKDPELLLELAEKAYSDVNNLSQQFAQLGRNRIEMERRRAEQQAQSQPQQSQQQGPDLAKLKEQYDDDPFGATVELLKFFGQQSQPQQQQPQQALPKEQFQEDLALTQHIINFFGNKEMEPYNDFYGSTYDENGHPYIDVSHLTPGQQANRQRVLQIADHIIAGAEFQGEQMPIQQALSMAHMMTTGPIAKQIARKELVSQVKKKAKGVTLKPNSRKVQPPKRKEGEGKPEEQFEKDTEARLRSYKEGKPLK